MLTKKQILSGMGRSQNVGFYEPDFNSNIKISEKKFTIRLKLVYVELLKNPDVVIQKR